MNQYLARLREIEKSKTGHPGTLTKLTKPRTERADGDDTTNADSFVSFVNMRSRPFSDFSRCDHCGFAATAADPLHPWNWAGRPAGIFLHRRCEEAWYDSERGAA